MRGGVVSFSIGAIALCSVIIREIAKASNLSLQFVRLSIQAATGHVGLSSRAYVEAHDCR